MLFSPLRVRKSEPKALAARSVSHKQLCGSTGGVVLQSLG
jgi:hypothetical protein